MSLEQCPPARLEGIKKGFAAIQAAMQRGDLCAAERLYEDLAAENPDISEIQTKAARFLISRSRSKAALRCFERAREEVFSQEEVFSNYVRLLVMRDQRCRGETEALRMAREFHARFPESPQAAKWVGVAALLAGYPEEAATVFTAGGQPAEAALARAKAVGEMWHTFTLDGVSYTFPLQIFNTQMYGAALDHHAGVLTEPEELRETKRLFAGRRPRIVEVGILVGNHSIFYRRNLAPADMIMVEGDPEMIPVIEETLARNPAPEAGGVSVVNALAGDGSGATRALSDIVGPREVDFIKADVDGNEAAFLEGARPLLERTRPVVMMEEQAQNKDLVQAFFAKMGYSEISRFEHNNYANVFFTPA